MNHRNIGQVLTCTQTNVYWTVKKYNKKMLPVISVRLLCAPYNQVDGVEGMRQCRILGQHDVFTTCRLNEYCKNDRASIPLS